ncbi:DDE superfamily endonuclease [Pochonia chlamydosporia 170]|uniref:DDE superfamily endonuclease n=1 Tax=Pochonia chlamydosporia 170 TaxID=1380566 RepID=A0A179EWX7_METCM|nr:DDE superfamily endonuclease [Pochonia chlamydosporia 170]OAQ57671.2 DDE superfamily endonuclease [Pochonia chlamydosporia 170]
MGYFTLLNAYNNDTMMHTVAETCGFNSTHRRLRCNGHIINLAVQAFLFGKNKEASDEALRQVSRLSRREQEGAVGRAETATAWRQYGALGMLHNLVVWIRSSTQRYQAFLQAAGRMIPQDNSTRWNSWYRMIHVAIALRKELNSFMDDRYSESDIRFDYLHPEHWQELQEIHDFLQPFYEITKDTQWDKTSLDEVICSMDFLVTHYKAAMEQFQHNTTMVDRIMTSWYKFDDYYTRTDDTPVYAAAILLHPSLREAHLKEAWKDQPQYIGPAIAAVRKLWDDFKPQQEPEIEEDLSAYEAYKKRIYQKSSCHDEFSRFIEGPTLPIGDSSALSWWLEPTQQTSYPSLYHLAINIFSIPAMSAEAERVFSGARRTVSWDRGRLSAQIVEYTECLKHWIKSGLLDQPYMIPEPMDAELDSRDIEMLSEEETEIIKYILDLDSRSFPPRLSGVQDMANRLLADRHAPPVGVNWASNFVRRRKELSTRFTRRYDYQRALCEDPKIIKPWFELVRNTVAKYGIQDEDFHNFDETGFMMGVISTTMVVTSSERRGKPSLAQPGDRKWVSVLQSINSQGEAIPPFIIAAGQFHLGNWYEDSALPKDWVISTTHNGWTTNEKAVDWIRHFEKHTKPKSRGAYRLLILDGHESHHSTEFEVFCRDHKIITLCMPSHSSHILQPLDVGCFGPLKKAYGKEIEGLMRAHITHITQADFFPAFCTAFKAAMTKENIQGAFRGAGLVPFNPNSVLSRLDVRLRTPTPVEEAPELPNPLQREHAEFMHQVALLKAEVNQLREANALLSKRRRAKKTRLRQGGSMTIAEGQALQDQNDVEDQIQQEDRKTRGRKPRDETKGRRCGVCGKTGHNARTCQIDVEASNEDDSSED